MYPDPNNNSNNNSPGVLQPDPNQNLPFPPPPVTDFSGTQIPTFAPPSIPVVSPDPTTNNPSLGVDFPPPLPEDNPYLNGQMGSYVPDNSNNNSPGVLQPDPNQNLPFPPPPIDVPMPPGIPLDTSQMPVFSSENLDTNINLQNGNGASFSSPNNPIDSPLINDSFQASNNQDGPIATESFSNPYINPNLDLESSNDYNPDKADTLKASDILEVPVGSPSDSFVGSSVLKTPPTEITNNDSIPDLVNNISAPDSTNLDNSLTYDNYDSGAELGQDAKKEKLIKMIIIGLAGLFALILILVLIFSLTGKKDDVANNQNTTTTTTTDDNQNTDTSDQQEVRKEIPSDAPLKDFKWYSTNCFSFQIPEPTTLSGEGGDEKNCIIPQNTFGSFKITTFSVSYMADTINDVDTAIEDWKGKNAGVRIISQDDTELDGEPAVQILYENPAGANSETSKSSAVFVMKKYKFKGLTFNGFIIECLTYNDWSVGKFKDILKTWYWR